MVDNPKAPKLVMSDTHEAAPDPFNLEALRLPPAFAQTAGVKKVLSTVPVRKPHNSHGYHSGSRS